MSTKLDDYLDLDKIHHIIPRIAPDEKFLLYNLAGEVPENGSILEIGSAYGASAACLALGSQNKVRLVLVDNFIYQQFGQTSPELLARNLLEADIQAPIVIIPGDSRGVEIPKYIYSLVHIDGCHIYEVVKSDLERFAVLAPVVVCHDYPPEAQQPGVTKAVNEWLELHPEYHKAEAVNRYIVLRKGRKDDPQ